MKKIIKGRLLLEYIDKAITLLSDAVKITLGPNGNNVIINDSKFNPYITNDGVTIASAINDDNEIMDTILTIIKEAALKTNSDVGDGTTTTIVLLESIYKNSISLIKNSNEMLNYKKELQESLKKIINKLNNYSKIPSKIDLEKIACISANDEKIGKLIAKFYLDLNKSNNIKIEENLIDSRDYVVKLQGYFFENSLASPYFSNEKHQTIKSPTLILYNKEINYIEDIEQIIFDYSQMQKNLIIIADSFANEVINEVLAINYEAKGNIILINNPEYGSRKLELLDDLKIISNAKNINNHWVGNIKEFKADEKEIYLIYDKNNKIKDYLNILQKKLKEENDQYNQIYLKDRISKLENIYGNIYVGGQTSLERREKKMRFTDALCALEASSTGICPGGGLVLYQISEEIKKETLADLVLSKSLKDPLIQILKNSNVNYRKIIQKIKIKNYQKIYNAKNKTFESISNTNVLDNKSVIMYALSNAVSIASLLLTTSHLVINDSSTETNLDNF